MFVAVLVVGSQMASAAWYATGPFGGDAEIVRVIPAIRGEVIAAARDGLLFRSTNGGAFWENVPFPAQFAGVLHALEVDPRSPSTWYAGVESENNWVAGIYKTIDGGRSWTLLPQTKGWAVWSLALWPGNADVIAAGTGAGVYLSQNAGAAWKRISAEGDSELRPVVSLAFHPRDAKILYAGTTHLPWATSDGGATWHSIHEGMIDDSDVFSIQVDAQKPDRLFASACSGVYGSNSAGARWSRFETPKGAFRTHFVALDPKQNQIVFAGTTEGLLRSADGGHSWRKVSAQSVKSIAFDPWVQGRIFFASPTGGLLLSTDGGLTLRDANVGFTNRNFTTLTGSGSELYSSSVYESSSGGVYRTGNLGLRWVHAGDPPSDELLLMSAAPDDASQLYAAGYHSLLESADAGKTWRTVSAPPGGRVTALLALSGRRLLAGTEHGLFIRDRESAWKQCASDHALSLQRTGKGTVAALVSGGALASADAGATWKRCGNTVSGAAWYGVVFDSGNPSVALAATSAGVFRSGDACVSWSPVRAGLRAETASAVLFHPARPGEAFVSQGGRIFRSTDGGQHWLPTQDDAQSNSGPSSFFVLPAAPDRLFALFPRRGVFSTSIKEKAF
jgi:photosystem II stability/assembly factor-like uncharacterized protein